MKRGSARALEEGPVRLKRLVALIVLLRSETLSGPQLVERLPQHYRPDDSGKRQLRRDIEQLEAVGFKLARQRRPRRGYTILNDPLAAIELSDDQIDLLAMLRDGFDQAHPFWPALERLLTLLVAGLDGKQRRRFEGDANLHLGLNPVVSYETAQPLFEKIQSAIRENRKVHFDYYSLDRRERPRRHIVDPYKIEYQQQHFYLVGYSSLARQIINFRLDQIDTASFDRLSIERDDDHDLYPYQFRYRLTAYLAQRGISARFHDQQVVQQFADGSVEIAARARSEFYAIRGLLRYAQNARATFPVELVMQMRATLDAMRAEYED
jgi:predicted DNA-binding transcriptional regulator YafY